MEAVRVRAIACGDTVDPGLPFDAFKLGLAVPAVEVGTLNRSAAILMQAGFTSRLAAIKAIADTGATFEDSHGLRTWLRSEPVVQRTSDNEWPTTETAEIWKAFLASFVPPDKAVWKDWTFKPRVTWVEGKTPQADALVRVVTSPDGDTDWVLAPDHEYLGSLVDRLHGGRRGIVKASVDAGLQHLNIAYVGPTDLTPAQIG